jgi:hypothetical protein
MGVAFDAMARDQADAGAAGLGEAVGRRAADRDDPADRRGAQ